MLFNCPSVLLVNTAVIPIIHGCAVEFPTGFAEENNIESSAGTLQHAQTPGCVADHLSISPAVTLHVHILCSLSLGHSPLSSRSLQIKLTLAKAANKNELSDKGSHINRYAYRMRLERDHERTAATARSF